MAQATTGIKDINPDDTRIIINIARRASDYLYARGHSYPVIHAVLDVAATHKQVPLMLADLLNADNSNFYHDVLGIRRHMNRETGKLEGCFMPRFAAVYHTEQ